MVDIKELLPLLTSKTLGVIKSRTFIVFALSLTMVCSSIDISITLPLSYASNGLDANFKHEIQIQGKEDNPSPILRSIQFTGTPQVGVPTICYAKWIFCSGTLKVIVSAEGGPLKPENFMLKVTPDHPALFPGKSFGVPELVKIGVFGSYAVDEEYTPPYKTEMSPECKGEMTLGG